MATSWDERNAQKRHQEENNKLRVSTGTSVQTFKSGTSVQRINGNTPLKPSSLSDHKPSDPLPETATGDPLDTSAVGSPVGSPLESAPKTTKKRSRQLLKIRLEHADNAMNIVENWRLERQAAPKIVKAIELMAAVEAGNLDYVRENYPLLAEALQKSKKRNMTPPLKDSYKERESEPEEKMQEVELLATALFEATGSDPHLNPAVYDLATQLHRADYTADDVRLWYQKCWPKDWRGKKGDRPKLKEVQELVGQVRSLPVDQQGQAEPNPYLADPFFARATDDEPEPPVEEIPVWPPEGCNGGAAVKDPFLATLGQLQIQLNRATYDTWLKHAEPIHFAGDRMRGGTLYVSVPHVYCKDWIDRHLLTAMTETFDRIANYSGEKRGRISEELLFKIEIIVEGDPVPGVSNA